MKIIYLESTLKLLSQLVVDQKELKTLIESGEVKSFNGINYLLIKT